MPIRTVLEWRDRAVVAFAGLERHESGMDGGLGQRPPGFGVDVVPFLEGHRLGDRLRRSLFTKFPVLFPVSREKNTETGPIRTASATTQSCAIPVAASITCKRIPYASEQGIFSAEQGRIPKEQGSGANEQRST
jgi:hypothetical protein